MAVRIKFDKSHNAIKPTIVLATRSGKKLGVIQAEAIQISDSMNTYFELSFQVHKESNGQKCVLWDQIEDFKLVWCREWDIWFEIQVEISEANSTVKNINAISLGEAELGQVMLYGIEINTENDISRDAYDADNPTVLYRSDLPSSSLLHRIMEKVPHYKIKHVDASIASIQRTFTFDSTSLYDAFQQIAEEISCIFVINSGTNKETGKIAREISVYDLEAYCLDCGYRDTYFKTCPKCNNEGGKGVLSGYGEDTTIFVSTENLADDITYTTDVDSVKNCFRLEGGDDLMTATITNCNANGSSYIWYISDLTKRDMSEELVKKLEEYDDKYDEYQNEYKIKLDEKVDDYNSLVDKYLDINKGSKNLEKIPKEIIGYPNLMTAYYNTIDFYLYLKSELMPTVKMQDTSAALEADKLEDYLINHSVAVSSLKSCSSSTASSTVLSTAKVVVDSRYQVKVATGEFNKNSATWAGTLTITNYSDKDDTSTTESITVSINEDQESYIKQKLDKALDSGDEDGKYGIIAIFDLDISEERNPSTGLYTGAFAKEIKKYGLSSLESFRDSCQECLDIMIEQGVADDETWAEKAESGKSNLYEKLYLSYYRKHAALLDEIKKREEEIETIVGKYDANENLISPGLQTILEEEQANIQEELNFEKNLGGLWLEFIAYRREDTYSNENYISDGLDNKELFEKALEFIDVAKKEIYKSATLQHSITASLKNLLVMKEFEPIVDYFSVGNWIRIRVNDVVYRLRLISYTIDFDNLSNISIEFSDVLECANGVSDVASILEQAASMATSYGSIQRQASQGNKANVKINDFLETGLNTALVQIQSNNSEDITMTKNGLLCRSYNAITDDYSPKQLKLTHNILALTEDNWETVSLGIGEHDFSYYDENEVLTQGTGYGVSAKFLTAGYINGSQIIGGDIYSINYPTTVDKETGEEFDSGSHINLTNGDFSFAGQKLVYDSKTNKLTLKGVAIDWENTNAPSVEEIPGLNATQIGENYVISPNIMGGYLYIKDARTSDNTGTSVEINPNGTFFEGHNSEYIFSVSKNGTPIMGVTNNGDGYFNGKITATSGNIGSLTLQKGALYKGTSSMTSTAAGIYLGEDGFRQYKNANAYVNIQNGVITAAGADIRGKITATQGKIGCFNIDGDSLYTIKDGLASYTDGNIYLGSDGIAFGRSYLNSNGGIAILLSQSLINEGYSGSINLEGNEIKICGANPDIPSIHLVGATGNIVTKIGSSSITLNTSNAHIDASSTDPYFLVKNSTSSRYGGIHASSSGNIGLFDKENSAWIIRSDIDRITRVQSSNYVLIQASGFAVRVGDGFDTSNNVMIPVTTGNEAYDGKAFLGASSSRWHTVYSKNGHSTSSDERDKIMFNLDERYYDWFNKLDVIGYRWKDEENNRINIGVGAQSIELSAIECGLNPSEIGAILHDYWDNPINGRTDRYSLHYEQLSMLTIPVVQKHENRILQLEEKVKQLEQENKLLREAMV